MNDTANARSEEIVGVAILPPQMFPQERVVNGIANAGREKRVSVATVPNILPRSVPCMVSRLLTGGKALMLRLCQTDVPRSAS